MPFGAASTDGALIEIIGGWMSVARMNRLSRPDPLMEATSMKYVWPAWVTKSTLDVSADEVAALAADDVRLRDRAVVDGDRASGTCCRACRG